MELEGYSKLFAIEHCCMKELPALEDDGCDDL